MIQSIHDIHESCRAAGRPAVSFEFFPPKTPEGERNLLEKTIPALMELKPDYCSVTYGAGGTTRDKTIGIVDRIQREHGLTTMMHLTCVNSTKDELASVLAEAKARGIKNILALRGDPPPGAAEWKATEGGFTYSSQLVEFLKQLGGFCIGTAGFPEGHIAQKGGRTADWAFLCEKIAAGADFVITQLFFDNVDFYSFHDYLSIHEVKVPIIPGVLPVSSAKQTKKFTEMCGARLPEGFLKRLDEIGDDDEAAAKFGIQYATEQCRVLLKSGVQGIHFYTLNKAASTTAIVRNLGLA